LHLWIAALLTGVMGLVLGLLGGGGSILTVPILVYVLGVEAHAAIAFSLVLVGGTALVAALLHNRKARVDWKDGLLFASFGAPMNLLAAYLSRRLSGPLLLLLFGMVMGIAGIAMLRRVEKHQDAPHKHHIRPAIASGAAVGLLTGFLGIGGGFLIVPALVLFLEMPMKLACGTSLLVIAANSGVALFGRLHSLQLAWIPLLALTAPSLVATYLGVGLSERFSATQLRKAFAVFIIVLGILMMANNAATLLKH
jgi:uncharacterized membrane protein YfcA